MPAPRPVRCLETGQVYPSISCAARSVHVVQQTLSKAVRKGGRAAGFRWMYADDNGEDLCDITEPDLVALRAMKAMTLCFCRDEKEAFKFASSSDAA
eukprot:g78978.t1